jgi:hypothetical protein
MPTTSRFETPLNSPGNKMKLLALIADLQWRVRLLTSDIVEEEKRTNIFLASNLRARRDNIIATIALLERELAGVEQPAVRSKAVQQ